MLTGGRRSDALIKTRENDQDIEERERDDRDICSNVGETRRSGGKGRVLVLSNVQTIADIINIKILMQC